MDMQEFEQQLSNADLLIVHGGAGSIIQSIHAGKVPVVVPRRMQYNEHVDDHQMELARELEKTGRIVVCEDVDELHRCTRLALKLQSGAGMSSYKPAMLDLINSVIIKYSNS